mmetsp:Transcript_18383/g.57040  ORF Transcript_18383/g.57040 Transcript_18383/m.57040 type:complete len:248 (-) Transcript_18383:1687-2430(-)
MPARRAERLRVSEPLSCAMASTLACRTDAPSRCAASSLSSPSSERPIQWLKSPGTSPPAAAPMIGVGPMTLSMSRLTCRAVRSSGIMSMNEFWCTAPSMGGAAVVGTAGAPSPLKSKGAGGSAAEADAGAAGARSLSFCSAAPSPRLMPPMPPPRVPPPASPPPPKLSPRERSASSVDCRMGSERPGKSDLSSVSSSCVPVGPADMWLSIMLACRLATLLRPAATPGRDACRWKAEAVGGSASRGGT